MKPDTTKNERETLFLRVEAKILSDIEDLAKKEGITRNNYILRLLKKGSGKKDKREER